MRTQKLMVALVLLVFLVAGAAFAAPRLVLPQTEFNFGFVPQNSQITHVFWLYSKGDDSLKIISVKPG